MMHAVNNVKSFHDFGKTWVGLGRVVIASLAAWTVDVTIILRRNVKVGTARPASVP
jgi:hypothetical protein